ncbi:MAG: MarC family protein [Myxococcales bacterium]|nr:MAG: MarC family protein [Myxococcales bacterium]
MSTVLALIIAKALQLFLVLDPIGNTGIVATLISNFSKGRQKVILYREVSFALIILLIFYFSGTYLLAALNVSHAAVTVTGGIIFLFFSISLLFPGSSMVNLQNLEEEPFLVPIAMPLVVGPSSIATVILIAHEQEQFWLYSLSAVLLAWLFTAIIILLGPFLLSKVGKTGMHVAERVIGMVCALIAVKMLLRGIKLFLAGS